MPFDLTHWRSNHATVVNFMVSVAALGMLICIVGLIYLHFRDRRLRELRRTHYRERDGQRSRKKRRRK